MAYPSDYTNQDAKALELARLAAPLLATYATPYTDKEVREAVRSAQRLLAESARAVADEARKQGRVDFREARIFGGPKHAHQVVCERLGVCYCPTPSTIPVEAE